MMAKDYRDFLSLAALLSSHISVLFLGPVFFLVHNPLHFHKRTRIARTNNYVCALIKPLVVGSYTTCLPKI